MARGVQRPLCLPLPGWRQTDGAIAAFPHVIITGPLGAGTAFGGPPACQPGG
jgi:hypothetical protein